MEGNIILNSHTVKLETSFVTKCVINRKALISLNAEGALFWMRKDLLFNRTRSNIKVDLLEYAKEHNQ